MERLPSKFPCGQAYNITHALNCKIGGFVTISYNKVRHFEAQLLKKPCNNVEIEPPLQLVKGGIVDGLSADNVKPDVHAS